jgi:hypothetical protein
MVLRLISAVTALMLAPCLFAAVDPADLKLDGQTNPTIGRRACPPIVDSEKAEVEVLLPNSALNNNTDFQAVFSTVKQGDTKAKGDSVCDKSADKTRFEHEFTKDNPKIPLKKFLKGGLCGPSAVPGSRVLCIYDDSGKELLSYAIFNYDTTVAKIDSITEHSAANGEVTFKVNTSGASSLKIRVCYGEASDATEKEIEGTDCPITFKKMKYTSNHIKITELQDGVTYAFKVQLINTKDGDDSEWFKPFKLTPVPVAFPLKSYNGRGGELGFSCQQSGQSSVVFLIMALLIMMLVRARPTISSLFPAIAAVIVMNVFLQAQEAHAEFGQMNIGLLGAMYRPDLDNEMLGQSDKVFPFYKCYFRKSTSDQNGPINPLMGAEIDWHLWDKFGSLQLGFGASYTFVTGRGVELDANNQPDCDAPTPNNKVSLHMYQLRPQLTYIFNPFAEYVPFVPYVRGALIGHGYMFLGNNKGATIKPNGFRFGYQAALGMMLMLDFLEPGSVRSARGEGLFEHVYLKGELAYTKIDTFGRPGLQFSAKDVMGTDWPLMWTFGLVFEIP